MVRARQLIGALRGAGHEVTVVENTPEGDSSGSSDILMSGYRKVIQRGLPRSLALPLRDVGRYAMSQLFGRRVAAVARKQGADILVETQTNCAISGAAAARLTGLPLIVDDCSPAVEELAIGSGLPGLARRALLEQARAASVLIATSLSVRDRLIAEGLHGDKIRVVRNGVNLAKFQEANGAGARSMLGLKDRCVFGFVGSFLEWHRVDLLIDALARVPERLNAHVLLVGTGPFLGSVLKQAEALNLAQRVTSVGSVSPQDVPGLMAAFDVGVLPDTLDYGNPMKLTEYAAALLPAIAPDRPSVRELVSDGRTGLLFRPGDAEALKTAMERLAGDKALRRNLGAQAYQDVATSAEWSVLAARLLEPSGDQPRTKFPSTARSEPRSMRSHRSGA